MRAESDEVVPSTEKPVAALLASSNINATSDRVKQREGKKNKKEKKEKRHRKEKDRHKQGGIMKKSHKLKGKDQFIEMLRAEREAREVAEKEKARQAIREAHFGATGYLLLCALASSFTTQSRL